MQLDEAPPAYSGHAVIHLDQGLWTYRHEPERYCTSNWECPSMGIREWSNNHPKATGGIAAGCVLICVGAIVAEAMGNRHAITTAIPSDYYSVDDGKTFFAASGKNVPPFNYQGQTAVRANVFECNGVKFVAYLDRYTPAAQKVMTSGGMVPAWVDSQGRELKRPGDKQWVSAADMKAILPIITVHAPDGASGTVEPVEPD